MRTETLNQPDLEIVLKPGINIIPLPIFIREVSNDPMTSDEIQVEFAKFLDRITLLGGELLSIDQFPAAINGADVSLHTFLIVKK